MVGTWREAVISNELSGPILETIEDGVQYRKHRRAQQEKLELLHDRMGALEITVRELSQIIEDDKTRSNWQTRTLFRCIEEAEKLRSTVDDFRQALTNQKPLPLLYYATLSPDAFEQGLKRDAYPTLKRDEIRAIRIIQNWDGLISRVHIPERNQGRKVVYRKFIPMIKTGERALGQILGQYEGGTVRPRAIRRAMRCVCAIGDEEHWTSEKIDIDLEDTAPIRGPTYTFLKNRLIDCRPINEFEIHLGTEKSEYLLFRTAPGFEEEFSFLFEEVEAPESYTRSKEEGRISLSRPETR